MIIDNICHDTNCTYNSGFGGFGRHCCSKNKREYDNCSWKQTELSNSTIDELHDKLVKLDGLSLYIEDVDTRDVVREISEIIRDMLELITDK